MVKLILKLSVFTGFGYFFIADLKRKNVGTAKPNVDGLIVFRYFCSVTNEVISDSVADFYSFVSSNDSASDKLKAAQEYLSKKLL